VQRIEIGERPLLRRGARDPRRVFERETDRRDELVDAARIEVFDGGQRTVSRCRPC